MKKSRARSFDVYAYLDYRQLLRDYYEQRKSEARGFSYRAFARRAGVRSPNHLKRVMDGDRSLSETSAAQYAVALGLVGEEAEYFLELVRFNQASGNDARGRAYRRLTEFRGYRRAHRLDAFQDRYHSAWYIPAMREMIARADFRPDPAWLAGQMIPAITEHQAAEALHVLEELQMIRVNEDGGVTRVETVVSTGPETASIHVGNYHRSMMAMAMESLDSVSAADRDISAVTLCVEEGAIAELKERVRAFRKEIIAMEAADLRGDRVVQIGIQVFPLTHGRSKP
jgi:uncharacterized protein (TIGR02147 family)